MAGHVSGGVCPICRKFRAKSSVQLALHASTCQDKTRLRQASRTPVEIAAFGPETTAELCMVPIHRATPVRSQNNTSAPTVARAAGCCVVVGKVCWFCHKPEQIRKDHRNPLAHTSSRMYTPQGMQDEQNQKEDDKKDNAYGNLPILYHLNCAAAHTNTQTDEAIIAAYKALGAAGGSKRESASNPVGVDLVAMRKLSSSWLHGQRKEEATPTESKARSASQQQVWKPDSHDDSDSEDSQPLCNLEADSTPLGQLVAKRTPFQAIAARPFSQHAVEEALQDDSVGPSVSIQMAASGQETTPASSFAEVFGSRPGHSWELSGLVNQLPPVYNDEKRVLSHHLSRRVTEMYEIAQTGTAQTGKLKIKVLHFFEDQEDLWDRALRNKVEKSAEEYLNRHIHGKMTLSNLPEDPPCLEGLSLQFVQTGDFRPGLVPGKDVTVHTTSAIGKGTVLGLYRNMTVTKAEERVIRNNPPAEFLGSKNEWRQKLDAYIADVEQPARKSQSWKKFSDIYHTVLKDQTLGCLAYMNGNILACINDGIADPMSDEPDPSADKDPNTQLVCIAVGRWPFMFVVATEDIAPRAELFLSYGIGFWEYQKQWAVHIQEDKAAERALASGPLCVDSQGGSQLRVTRSGPPVETAMSGNHGNPVPPPGIAMRHAPTAPSTLFRDGPPPTTSADTPDNEDGHAAESQPSHMDGCYRLQLDADSNDKQGDESAAAEDQQPGPLHQDPGGSVPVACPSEAVAGQTKVRHAQPAQAQQCCQPNRRAADPKSVAAAAAGLVSPKRSGMKRQHDSASSTLPNPRARQYCSLSDDIQHALRADSSTVAQQQQAVAAQIVYTDHVSPRASRLSAVYEDCLEGYGVKRGVYSNASLFANALSPAESAAFCRKRQKQDAADNAVAVTASAAHHELSPSAVDSRSAAASGAADFAQEISTRTGSDAEQQPDGQAHGEGTNSPLGQKRQLARLDSNTGSSPASSAAKKFCMPARPVSKDGQEGKADLEQVHDTEPRLAGRLLHRELSGSVNSIRTALEAGARCGSGPGNPGAVTATPRQFSAATVKHVHAGEPPRFNQSKPAVGKSRMAPGSSQQGRGGRVRSPVRSGAASGDSGARQQSKGSGSVRTAGIGGTQDTAAASDGSLPHKKASHRQPGNLKLKAVPRPSKQDRHSASLFGLRQSKAVSDAVPDHTVGMKQQQTATNTVPGFVSAAPKESIKWKQDNSMRVAKSP
ncbi:TPA: hypothetical protein ACH3X1_002044 [Trebouxia sp. C0004]